VLLHNWVVYGMDRWRGVPSQAESSAFLLEIAHRIGPPGARLLVLCSVGVRSEVATRVLRGANYRADNVMDGWLGNDMGPGLRANER
jgi:rhodanese-related sulfurtransferase